MSTLTENILAAAQSIPEGGIISPKQFLHFGSRVAVDQALSRLAKEGSLLRVARGAYVLPVVGRFGSRSPSTETVVAAIETQSGEVIVANGVASANALGLTTQVPVQETFLTSGRSRTLRLGARTVQLQHGARWQLILGKRAAGMAIRALAWMGQESAHETLAALKIKLPPAEWEALLSVRAILPTWMAKASGEFNAHG